MHFRFCRLVRLKSNDTATAVGGYNEHQKSTYSYGYRTNGQRRTLLRYLFSLARRQNYLLTGEIDDNIADLVVAQLIYLEGKDSTKDISLYINSPGGSVSAGFAIYDTMNYIKCDVSTICIGMAASMGAFLLSSGAKGKRYSLPNAKL